MTHGKMAGNVTILYSVTADHVFSWCSKYI